MTSVLFSKPSSGLNCTAGLTASVYTLQCFTPCSLKWENPALSLVILKLILLILNLINHISLFLTTATLLPLCVCAVGSR